MPGQTITTLAILKSNWDMLGKDYVETFVPFVVESIRSLDTPVVSVGDVQSRLRSDFGLEIPQHALEMVLHRAAKRGYIRREHKAYFPVPEVMKKVQLDSVRRRVLGEHEVVLNKLIEFAANLGENWEKEKAESCLYCYFKKYDVQILRTSVGGKIAIADTTTGMREEVIISAFIKHLYQFDKSGFEYMDTLMKGNMLANVMLFSDLGSIDKKFRNTIVFCDTVFLLRVLGYEGPRKQAPCLELLNILYEANAEVKCFQDTMEEVKSVLRSWSRALSTGQIRREIDPGLRYLQDKGYRSSDVELDIVKLEARLNERRIYLTPRPQYEEQFQLDEEELERALASQLGYQVGGGRALKHDVDCISAICRLRKGASYKNIEECSSIFLTCNDALVRVAKRFTNEDLVPLAVTDSSLTTILWLKRPMSSPDLPKKRIIADCYAAMEPPHSLWKKYLDEIEKLEQQGDISPDDVYLLRFSLAARDELMLLTLGDEHAFVEGTVSEILEKVKAEIRAEVLAEANKERKRREEAEANLAVVSEKETHRSEKRRAFAERIARLTSRSILFIVVLLLCFGAWAAFPSGGLANASVWYRWLLFTLASVFVVFTLYSLITGASIRGILRSFELKFAVYLDNKLRNWFEP